MYCSKDIKVGLLSVLCFCCFQMKTPVSSKVAFTCSHIHFGLLRFWRHVKLGQALPVLWSFNSLCPLKQSKLWIYYTNYVKPFSKCYCILCLQVVVTLSFSYMVGTIASFHNTVAVVITMGATLAITVAIIAFSAQVRQPGWAASDSSTHMSCLCLFKAGPCADFSVAVWISFEVIARNCSYIWL